MNDIHYFQAYARTFTTNNLFTVWMALEDCETPTFQGLPIKAWDDIVYAELKARGVFEQKGATLWDSLIGKSLRMIAELKTSHEKQKRSKVRKVIAKRVAA